MFSGTLHLTQSINRNEGSKTPTMDGWMISLTRAPTHSALRVISQTAEHSESRLKPHPSDCRPHLPLAQCGLKTNLDPRQNRSQFPLDSPQKRGFGFKTDPGLLQFKLVVRYYLSGVRCKWFAYGPADATANPSSLALVKSRFRNGLPFWCRLTHVVLEKRPLSRCSCSTSMV